MERRVQPQDGVRHMSYQRYGDKFGDRARRLTDSLRPQQRQRNGFGDFLEGFGAVAPAIGTGAGALIGTLAGVGPAVGAGVGGAIGAGVGGLSTAGGHALNADYDEEELRRSMLFDRIMGLGG